MKFTDKLAELWESLQPALSVLAELWNFSIIEIDNRPLTIGKFVVALLVFAVGIFIIRKVSRYLTGKIFKRLIQGQSNVATLQALTYYALLAFLVLFALSIANIPLTVFTVVGGALAIGVGFGSQNILKNFISGIILMFDRPIKVGDMVEINDEFGLVESIGFRATRILSFGNKHLVFPNSNFLETSFTNWTLTDRFVRFNVPVGVAYGSDANKVTELLREAASSHERVLDSEPPSILFYDFGDNALIFLVFFSIRINDLKDRKTIESDLRYKIYDLFNKNDITIAFPQRDVHLDNLSPIEVKISEPKAS